MYRNRRSIALLAALALSACGGKDSTAPAAPPPPPPPPPATYAVVTPTITAAPIWEVGYAWELEASQPDAVYSLGALGSAEAQFSLTVNRGQATSRTGVSGQVCVSNSGTGATQGLQVLARVQRQEGEDFVNVAGASQALAVSGQIGVGQSQCFPYEILFDRDEAVTYRTVPVVSITNAQVGSASNTPPSASIAFPAEPQATDASATLTASIACASGFSCSAPTSSWELSQSGSESFNVTISESGATCGTEAEIGVTFTLDGGASAQAVRSFDVQTDDCAPPPSPSCTHDAAYWKASTGLNGNPDYVSEKLPILLGTAGGAQTVTVSSAAQARDIFDHLGQSSNGINKLYRELLTLRLNLAYGADGSAIAAVVADVDAYLATTGSAAWNSLTNAQKSQVNAWKDALESYNAGASGPGACS